MCGFLAEYTFGAPLTSVETFESLLALSKHRGPDSTGFLKGDGFQLGFNRLAVLDVSSNGNQPKQSPSKRYHVVFNGELYNYKELSIKSNLTNLSSSSDTEVLIHLLDIMGVEMTIKALNGIFAIAIVDTLTDQFYMARDFSGVKPLFFGMSSEGIVAASQFDQVNKHVWIHHALNLNPEIVKEYFAIGYMQAPNTIYKNIFQLLPGELISITRKGVVSKKQLTNFGIDQKAKKETQSLYSIIKSAVGKQLVSDVPIASFLSGGIDSPLISAYAKKQKLDLEVFTLEVSDKKLNESIIAKSYADHLQIKQNIVSVKPTDILSEIDGHFKVFPEPFGDYSSIPTYVISKEARKRHTVMLSGDGGDELFFGYPRMLDILNKRWWFKLPYIIRKPLAQLLNTLGITHSWAPYFKDFNTFVLNKHTKLPKSVLDRAFKKISFSKELNRLYTFRNKSRSYLLNQLRYNEFYAHLQRVLIKVDRASMGNGLEVRVPFLDKEVVDWAYRQMGDLRTKKDLKKQLKQLLADELPVELINQKKMGFSIPLADWLRNELKTDVMQMVFKTDFYGEAIMDVGVLRDYVNDFYVGKHNNAWGVWHIYAWQKWAYN